MVARKRAESGRLICGMAMLLIWGAWFGRARADEPPATLGDIFRRAQERNGPGNRTPAGDKGQTDAPSGDKKRPTPGTGGEPLESHAPLGPDHALRGYLKRTEGNERGAIEEFDKAIEQNPLDAYSLQQRGEAHLSLDQFKLALADFNAVLAIKRDDTQAIYQRSRANAALWQYDAALADADDLAERRQLDAVYLHWLRGDIQKQWGLLDAALAEYEQAAELEPDSAFGHFALGEMLAAVGRAEEAVAEFDKAIELEPDKSGSYFNRATARAALGDWAGVIADLDEFLRLEPESVKGLVQRAAARALLGDSQSADDDYQAAAKLAGEGHLAPWQPRLFTPAVPPPAGATPLRSSETETKAKTPADDENNGDDENLPAEFAIARYDQGLIVPVRIGGQMLRFIIDTGCSSTCLDQSLAHLLGSERKKIAITTGGSEMVVPLFDPIELSIGELPPITPAGPIGCVDLSGMRSLPSMHLDGLLGIDVLSQLVLRVDLARHRFYLQRSAGQGDGAAIPFCERSGRKLDPADPLSTWRCPRVMVTLPDGKAVETLIDTGMMDKSLSLSAETFEALRGRNELVSLRSSLAGSLGEARMVRCGVLTSCGLGELRQENLIVDESTTGARIGLEFLTRYVATFDFPNHRLLLEPSPWSTMSMAELTLRSGHLWSDQVVNWSEQDVLQSLDELVDDGQTRAFGLRSRATFHATQKHFDQAIADFSAAIALLPRDASLFYHRGRAGQRAGKYQLALADYTRAAQLAPRWDLPVYFRAVTRLFLRDYRRAIPDFDAAIRLDSKWAAAFNDRGAAWAALGYFRRAEQDFRQALRIEPDDATAARNLKAIAVAQTKARVAAETCRGPRHARWARWRARRAARACRWR